MLPVKLRRYAITTNIASRFDGRRRGGPTQYRRAMDVDQLIAADAPLSPLLALVAIIVLGGLAQWIAWGVRLPSILLLLLIGFAAGPLTGIIDPNALFGSLLRPFVSVAVAIILFEGGLSLNAAELRGTGGVVYLLVSVGLLVTGAVCAAAAHYVVDLEWPLAVLLGAILTVTGPTVVMPLLRHVRPQGPVGRILKWEGIVIDPIGALLAVLVFEAIVSQSRDAAASQVALSIFKTILAGGGFGLVAAACLAVGVSRYWVPLFLQNAVALMFVVGAFAGSNYVQAEAGLLAVTVMGLAMANQRFADVRHIVEFKENLRVLLISMLFIVLSARLRLEDIRQLGVAAVGFVVVVIFIARPLAVLASTIGSSLKRSERVFLMWMAPRGIVAASVSSVFAIEMVRLGNEQARLLVPLTFATIVATVLFYGLTAAPIARWLRLAERDPQGMLIVGANPIGRAIADALKAEGIATLLADSNPANIAAARLAGHRTYLGSILDEHALDDMNLAGIGRMLALTPNDPVNILAVQRFRPIFGAAGVYQLTPEWVTKKRKKPDRDLHGRLLFGDAADYAHLSQRVAAGHKVKATRLSEEFNFDDLRAHHGDDALPLFVAGGDKKLRIVTADQPFEPRPDRRVFCLIRPEEK